MIPSKTPSTRIVVCGAALIALACAFCLSTVSIPAAKAADGAAAQRLEDKAPSLPLTYSFEKVADTESGPYVLKLKNVSSDPLKVSAQVTPSVTFHANSKVRNVPEHVIDPGQVWTITELAATDKVTVRAMGFAPLELVVP